MELKQLELLLVLISYLLFLVLWGIYQGRKVKTNKDYAIASRKLPGWVASLSERATGESAWALLGLPGAAYALGFSEIWTAIGCVSGVILAWVFIAPKLQKEAQNYDCTVFTDFLEKKHQQYGKTIKIVSSVFITFFFFFYVGAQFLGGGKILKTLFNVPPSLGMFITAAVIIPYTVYGGFRSVVYTDVVQALIMLCTLVLGPIVYCFVKHVGFFCNEYV